MPIFRRSKIGLTPVGTGQPTSWAGRWRVERWSFGPNVALNAGLILMPLMAAAGFFAEWLR